MAPEIVSRVEYRGDKADVWALGVVLFALLQGYFPFKGATDGELYKRIQAGELQMTLPVSDSAKSLLESMLHVDPECRFSASEILRHQWMKGAVKKVKPIIAEISLDHELKNQSRTTKHEDIMTNISFITPPN
jgi:MAP/microtubule affinity-regulating kinase